MRKSNARQNVVFTWKLGCKKQAKRRSKMKKKRVNVIFLKGTVVEARVKDGCKFRGVFHGASTEGDLAIALNLAQKIFDPQSPIEKDRTNPNSIINTLLIYSKDLVEITITEVNLNESSHVSERNSKSLSVYILIHDLKKNIRRIQDGYGYHWKIGNKRARITQMDAK